MNLYFATEARFIKRSNGNIYSQSESFSDSLWVRYLSVYDQIYVIARVSVDDKIGVNEKFRISDERVHFIEIPYYVGPVQYLKVAYKIRKVLDKCCLPGSAYICRVPGQIGSLVSSCLKRKNISYGAEVVGDPWDVFAPGAFNHPMRCVLRYIGRRQLKRVVRNASAVLYVTKNSLQKRYRANRNSFTVVASNVRIENDSIALQTKKIDAGKCCELISVGSLEQMYKSPDIVLKAVSILREKNINCRLTWLGGGRYQPSMEELAKDMKISEYVDFRGDVSSAEVRDTLHRSDIFILASKTEGLPRAVIEAMACGLPCIGTKVGGIPELLDKDVLVEVNDAEGLADKVIQMLQDASFANEQANRNLEEARKYKDSVLSKRREAFYKELIRISE
ncbi:glycosyltransferase [Coprobacter tertius]|uniref:Glycosyltransferase family 4 protein n=1 Tax=Coprobacter tertius TaxID=2944915 RepID=A0ABT1MJM7_9BACT|nr:glycosyltransferase [Coprobacter tertius]MCP9612823.1 glycosyltransferase family 4 protein [Coprobacter tertius]